MTVARKIDEAFLKDVAQQYQEHVAAGAMPAPAIAATENAPVRTVHRWIYEARKRGLLDPGTPPGLCGGPVPQKPIRGAGTNVRLNVRRLREGRKLSYVALAEMLAEEERPIPVLGLRRIERGERRVDVDDLIALAAIFHVTPAFLLEPPAECDNCQGAPPSGFACTSCDTWGPE